jgi:hypothetical protein
MRKFNQAAALLSALVLSLGLAGVSRADDSLAGGPPARGGTFRCFGANYLRVIGTGPGAESHFTVYALSNVSSSTPITVERVRMFGASGGVLWDSDVQGLPPFTDGVYLGPASNLGAANNVLGPNQSTSLTSSDVLPFLLPAQRAIQTEIVWSAPVPVAIPEVAWIRITRANAPAGGDERARFRLNCRVMR